MLSRFFPIFLAVSFFGHGVVYAIGPGQQRVLNVVYK